MHDYTQDIQLAEGEKIVKTARARSSPCSSPTAPAARTAS